MNESNAPVSVEHARRLIKVYGEVRPSERPWYYQWALTIDRLATALERVTEVPIRDLGTHAMTALGRETRGSSQ